MKKFPDDGKSLLTHANTFVKYMPIDKNSADLLSPLLSASSKITNYSSNIGGLRQEYTPQYKRMINSGSGQMPTNSPQLTKRSVGETKKKFVASKQNWKCAKCNVQLPAWFEVDHKTRLDRGGDNHINNLEALCRDCHGKKTAMESMI